MDEAPKGFDDHINYVTHLVEQVKDDALRVCIYDAIEVLIKGMNDKWQGAVVTWRIGEVPDDAHELFDD